MELDTLHALVRPLLVNFILNKLLEVDPCATNNGGCDPIVACINQTGSLTCGPCPKGLEGSVFNGTGFTPCTGIFLSPIVI